MYICIDAEVAKKENIQLSTITVLNEAYVISDPALQCSIGRGYFFFGVKQISTHTSIFYLFDIHTLKRCMMSILKL